MILGHEAIHTSRLGWGHLANGRLLRVAEDAGFAVMVTVDRSMQFQQNMDGRQIAVIYLRVPRNDLVSLEPMAEQVVSHLNALVAGSISILYHPDWRDL